MVLVQQARLSTAAAHLVGRLSESGLVVEQSRPYDSETGSPLVTSSFDDNQFKRDYVSDIALDT